ncbi:MAG TPA: hypothetical protein VGB53_03220 [Rubricoccaceae bacterium]|jgi:tetratricopeptide (TPR) repeat protein
MTRSLLLLLALAVLPACKSAQGVYTDAMALETSGDLDAAARAYADALRRDGSLPNARGRLGVAGREAVARRIAQAGAAGTRSEAATEWLAAEALVRDAAAVGVSLERPATFDADVRAACAAAVDGLAEAGDAQAAQGDADQAVAFYDRARTFRPSAERARDLDLASVTTLFDAGQARAEAGEFAAGLALLDRARRYRPTPDRQRDLDAAARTTLAAWADADLATGRFRSALAHADAALALAPPGSALAGDLAGLRAAVLDAGTLVVAVFPTDTPRTPVGDAFPDGFLRDVSDVLLDDRLAQPAPFLFLVDPAEARSALRQSRADLSGNPRLLADLTRRLDADIGVFAELDGFAFTEAETARRDVTFPRRDGAAAVAGVRTTTEMTLRARATVVAADASGRRIACDDAAPTVTVSERYDTATAMTAERDALRLSDAERDLFSAATRDRTYGRLVTELRDRLADRLAERIGACLARQVP